MNRSICRIAAAALALAVPLTFAFAREFHVAVSGNDGNDGGSSQPFKTISAAARVAQPGDTITVHEGTYRERITPPRGGESDTRRIVYQAARGEKVFIKGSEAVRNWKPFQGRVWKATVPNSLFGKYNPYTDLILGDWFGNKGRPHHTGEVYLNGKSLYESHILERVLDPQPYPDSRDPEGSTYVWYAEADAKNTYIYANFHDKDPNRELVEINVRDSCFYPDKPGRNYITIRGFHLSQAATQWAAPTAEQIGLIGTHWSKGWIIENNTISDSKCSGITLGKDRQTGHNVWINNPAKDGATHYNETIERALKIGWSRENIGSHIVRNNRILRCEQTGICGSMGAVFSRITNNDISEIWTKRQFTGAEIAGIKLHAAIDVLIQNNHIHNAARGLWMDWMAQGTHITGNLLYDNTIEDLFVEVDHGPFLVDNNIFLSGMTLNDVSEGGAYAHNLIAGRLMSRPEPKRVTPYHPAHSTQVAALVETKGGDDRFYNNILVGGEAASPAPTPQRAVGFGLWVYDTREAPLETGGNVYYNGARPYSRETSPVTVPGDPKPTIVVEDGHVYLRLNLGPEWKKAATKMVTTSLLGKTKVSGLAYENADGSPVTIDTDYTGKKRGASPSPGPFENPGTGEVKLRVWTNTAP